MFESPWVTYCFWSFSAAVSTTAFSVSAAAAAVLSILFNFLEKPLKLISSSHAWWPMGVEKCFGTHFGDLGSRLLSYQSGTLVPMVKWEPLIQSLQNLVGIFPLLLVGIFHLIKFWRYSAKKFFLAIFFCKIFKSVFPSRFFFLPYLRNGWYNWCETKRKWVNWILHWPGYLLPWPLTLNFQGQIVSREWKARLSWNERDRSP